MYHDKFCAECHKPIYYFYNICTSCSRSLTLRGFENHRVRLGAVGKSMIPYQQYLHRRFFGCNAPVKYRGTKEERIKLKISQYTITRASMKLDHYLGSMDNKHGIIYRRLEVKNLAKRILYYSTLFYLHYIYVPEKDNLFASKEHLTASINLMILIHIENTYLRVTGSDTREDILRHIYSDRVHYGVRFYRALGLEVEASVQMIVGELEIGVR